MQIYQNLHPTTGILQRIKPQVQNNNIEKYILMATSIYFKSYNGYIYVIFLTVASC